MRAGKFCVTIALCLTPAVAQAAGFRSIEVPVDAGGPALAGAIWYPCPEPLGSIEVAGMTIAGAKDCPLSGDKLPLVVLSHGVGGSFWNLHNTAAAMADGGFVVAAITHPDLSRRSEPNTAGSPAWMVERPNDIRRLITFTLGVSFAAPNIDRSRIGFYGFSAGGYTGLVLTGAEPNWADAPVICTHYASAGNLCGEVVGKLLPTQPLASEPRIKAAVLADPGPAFFNVESFAAITVPIQLWASEGGGPRDLVDAIDKVLPAAPSIGSWITPATLPVAGISSSSLARRSWSSGDRMSVSMLRALTASRSTSNSMRMCSRSSGHIWSIVRRLGGSLMPGFRFIEVPADADGPAFEGAMWYPCREPPGEIDLGEVTAMFGITVTGAMYCSVSGDNLPLVVISHGRRSHFVLHHDTAETLADAGFIVAAINHPSDTCFDMSRSDDLSAFVERPTDITRLIDFMLDTSPAASNIDAQRIGFYGFSRGGYTGLVLIGANPDWAAATAFCEESSSHWCEQIRRKEFPTQLLAHDPRIKAAVIADPLSVFFTADSLASVKVPLQLWASEHGGDGVTDRGVAAVDRHLPARHEYHVVPNSGHFSFLIPCPPALARAIPEICTDAPGFDRVAFHRQFNADVLAFFRAQLGNA